MRTPLFLLTLLLSVNSTAAGQDQAARKVQGTVTLDKGRSYPGTFVLTSGSTLDCRGATLTGSRIGPAINIPPGTHDVTVRDCSVTTTNDQRVILVGANDRSQTTVEQVPTHITFTRVLVPSYRGKRAFEISGADVTLEDCGVSDLWDPALRDSQTVAILNTPGPVRIHGGTYSGGSETIMIGGDYMKIPDVVPSDITLEDVALNHPLEWKNDGTKRGLKNLFEVKTGHRVVVRRVTMDGVWRDAQVGYAVVITPRSGGEIQDVLFEDVTITNVGGGFNMLGRDYAGRATATATSNVVLRRVRAQVSKSEFGGSGFFVLAGGELHDLSILDCTFEGDGPAFLSYYIGRVLEADGGKREAAPMESLTITGSTFSAGRYGLMLAGVPQAGPRQTGVKKLVVTGNTITGANAALRKNLPNNTYRRGAT
ncbi:MAG TPA: hypothetical protein VH458_20415 [Vicinamibacterales bacterium]|jgi:hypothetical protein